MGLDDRDYMKRPKRSVFKPPRRGVTGGMWPAVKMVFLWAGGIYLLVKAIHLAGFDLPRVQLPGSHPTPDQVAPAAPVPARPAQQPATPRSLSQPQDASFAPPTSDSRTITKCTINGTPTFTDGHCPSGAKQGSVTVNTAMVGTVAPHIAPRAFQEPVVPQPAVAAINQMPAPNPIADKQLECTSLEMEIKQVDAQARQPLSGPAQDELSARRKKARSQQFALHC